MAEVAQTVIAGADCGSNPCIWIINYLKRKHGYVKDMTKNYKKLEAEYKLLCARELDIKNELEIYKTEVDEREECKIWREKVEKMKVGVRKLEANYAARPSGPRHYCYLMKLGRRIVKKTGKISLMNASENTPRIMIRKGPAIHISPPADNIMKFSSVEEKVNKLHEYLRNEKIKTICLWGPLGVGKSTIMNRLEQEIKAPEDFGHVFKVVVGRENDEVYIQQELLKKLKINQENLSTEEKESKMSEKLKSYSSYLLLLDEVFSNINLKK